MILSTELSSALQMESSSYQTGFVVWDIPSQHSNHSDVLLTTFILHCPQGLAKLPGFPKQVVIAVLELSELALHAPASWPTSGSLNLPGHEVWQCADFFRTVGPHPNLLKGYVSVKGASKMPHQVWCSRRPGEMVLFQQACWKTRTIWKLH